MVGGVAGGLAAYLEVDPTLVRLGCAVLLFTGIGFLAYIVAWIVIPEEPLPAAVGAWPVPAASQQPAPGAFAPTPPAPPPSAPLPASPPRRGSAAGRAARLVVGTILIVVGAIILLDWAVPDLHHFLWPGVLIALGLGLFAYGARR